MVDYCACLRQPFRYRDLSRPERGPPLPGIFMRNCGKMADTEASKAKPKAPKKPRAGTGTGTGVKVRRYGVGATDRRYKGKARRGEKNAPTPTHAELVNLPALARTHTKEAIDVLAQVMRGNLSRVTRVVNPDDPLGRRNKLVKDAIPCTVAERCAAAVQLLDRGFGKPKQAVDVTHQPADLSKLTDDEIATLYELQCRVEGVEPAIPVRATIIDGSANRVDPAPAEPGEGGPGPIH